MADPASIRALIVDLRRPIEAYKLHLIPKRKKLLQTAIPLVAQGLGSFFGGAAGGKVAGAVATQLAQSGRFPAYVSPFALAVRRARAKAEVEVALIQRQLDQLLVKRRPGFARILRRTVGRRPVGFGLK